MYDSAALTTALTVLFPGQKLAVEKFAVDMHDPFISAIKQQCPNAEVVIDRFHLAQQINKAFDQVRRSEFKKARARKDIFQEGMLEPHRRFVLVARDADLSKSEIKLIDKLRLASKEIQCSMLMVEYFHKALDEKTVAGFRKVLARLRNSVHSAHPIRFESARSFRLHSAHLFRLDGARQLLRV